MDEENLYGSLFPSGNLPNYMGMLNQVDLIDQKSNTSKGGLFAKLNSGGFQNLFGNNNASDASSAVSDKFGGKFNFSTAGTLAGIGASMSKDVQTKSALGMAAQGAKLGSKLGPYGAGFGFLAGGIIGAVQGGEQKKKIEHFNRNVLSTEGIASNMNSQIKSSQNAISNFYGGQKKAVGNSYGFSDIDNFIEKNRV